MNRSSQTGRIVFGYVDAAWNLMMADVLEPYLKSLGSITPEVSISRLHSSVLPKPQNSRIPREIRCPYSRWSVYV
jgi:hypothetical protein